MTKVTGFLAALLLHIVTTGDSCCTEGFPDFGTVNSLAQACASDGGCLRGSSRGNIDGTIHVIPDMRITCNGSIVRWRAGGEIINGGREPDPRLQIWRPTPLTSTTYTVQTEISLFDCNGGPLTEVALNVYECSLSPGVPVQRGDILGIFLRRLINRQNQFRVYFDSSSTDPPVVTNYFYESTEITEFSLSLPGGQTEQALPLVALEIIEEGSTAETTTLQELTEQNTSIEITFTTPTREGTLPTVSQEETSSTDDIVSSEGSETTSSTSTVEENLGTSTIIGQNPTIAFTIHISEPQTTAFNSETQSSNPIVVLASSSSTPSATVITLVVTVTLVLGLASVLMVLSFVCYRRQKSQVNQCESDNWELRATHDIPVEANEGYIANIVLDANMAYESGIRKEEVFYESISSNAKNGSDDDVLDLETNHNKSYATSIVTDINPAYQSHELVKDKHDDDDDDDGGGGGGDDTLPPRQDDLLNHADSDIFTNLNPAYGATAAT